MKGAFIDAAIKEMDAMFKNVSKSMCNELFYGPSDKFKGLFKEKDIVGCKIIDVITENGNIFFKDDLTIYHPLEILDKSTLSKIEKLIYGI